MRSATNEPRPILAVRMGLDSRALCPVYGIAAVSGLVIIGNIACTKPETRQGQKLLNLMLRRENVRRTPSMWAGSPNYDLAIDAMKARMQ